MKKHADFAITGRKALANLPKLRRFIDCQFSPELNGQYVADKVDFGFEYFWKNGKHHLHVYDEASFAFRAYWAAPTLEELDAALGTHAEGNVYDFHDYEAVPSDKETYGKEFGDD